MNKFPLFPSNLSSVEEFELWINNLQPGQLLIVAESMSGMFMRVYKNMPVYSFYEPLRVTDSIMFLRLLKTNYHISSNPHNTTSNDSLIKIPGIDRRSWVKRVPQEVTYLTFLKETNIIGTPVNWWINLILQEKNLKKSEIK